MKYSYNNVRLTSRISNLLFTFANKSTKCFWIIVVISNEIKGDIDVLMKGDVDMWCILDWSSVFFTFPSVAIFYKSTHDPKVL